MRFWHEKELHTYFLNRQVTEIVVYFILFNCRKIFILSDLNLFQLHKTNKPRKITIFTAAFHLFGSQINII